MEDKKRSELIANETDEEVLLARRTFLISLGKWSAAVIGCVVVGSAAAPETSGWVNTRGGSAAGGGAWVNRGGGSWINGGGGWINRGGSWVNGRGGGGSWINRRGY